MKIVAYVETIFALALITTPAEAHTNVLCRSILALMFSFLNVLLNFEKRRLPGALRTTAP